MFDNSPARADAAREHAAHLARGAGRAAVGGRRRDRADAIRAGWSDRRERQSAADAARRRRAVLRAGRILAARRRSSPARRRASGCSTRARRPAARRPRWRRRWTTGLIVATDVRGRRVDLLRADGRAPRARTCVRVVQADASGALPFATRVRLRAARRALLRSRHAAPRSRTSGGAGSPDDFERLADVQVAMLARAADVVVPGGRLDLRDLFERARRERGGRRPLSRRSPRISCSAPERIPAGA